MKGHNYMERHLGGWLYKPIVLQEAVQLVDSFVMRHGSYYSELRAIWFDSGYQGYDRDETFFADLGADRLGGERFRHEVRAFAIGKEGGGFIINVHASQVRPNSYTPGYPSFDTWVTVKAAFPFEYEIEHVFQVFDKGLYIPGKASC